MRKLKLYIAASLDGKIAAKDHSLDWLPDPTAEDYGYKEFYESLDAVIMGHKTYEVCMGFGTWHYKDKTSYIFSRNAARSTIPEAKLVTEDPVAFVREMKQQEGKDIWVVGGGEIITLLHDTELINEYIIAIIPVILGEGVELFPSIKARIDLQLMNHRVYDNGAVLTYYEQKKSTSRDS